MEEKEELIHIDDFIKKLINLGEIKMWVVETNRNYYVFTKKESAEIKSHALKSAGIENEMYYNIDGTFSKIIKIKL